MPTRRQLNAICDDIPMYLADDEGRKGLANTLCLINAGIMKEEASERANMQISSKKAWER